MRRQLLTAAVLTLVLAGCGSAAAPGSETPPAPAELAGDAFTAFAGARSAHYVLDVDGTMEGDAFAGPFGFHLEGDASPAAMTGDGS